MEMKPGILERLEGFHSQIQDRLDRWFETDEGRAYPHRHLLVQVPDLFRLIVDLLVDERVPKRVRGHLVATLITVMSPADFLPENLLGPIGYEDDLLIMALVMFRVLEYLPEEVVLENWKGDENLLTLIPSILNSAERMVGPKLWRRLRVWVGEL
jgi:uncharacterized membrane protein YkvA (DUF1232 family)